MRTANISSEKIEIQSVKIRFANNSGQIYFCDKANIAETQMLKILREANNGNQLLPTLKIAKRFRRLLFTDMSVRSSQVPQPTCFFKSGGDPV